MLRGAIALFAVFATVCPACAEVWMVKASDVFGCRDRETLIALEASGAAPEQAPPAGCVMLYSGERLIDQPEVGVGFADIIRVQRHDGSTVFVRSSALVADPGIGSATEDRPE